MGRLGGFPAREVQTIAERLGWELRRVRGDHFVYTKAGNPENLSIPQQRDISEALLRRLLRTMGLTPDEFLRLAKK